MKRNRFGVLVVLCFVLVSCHRTMNVEEFNEWVEDYDNGAHVKKESGKFRFDVLYQPVELLVAQREGSMSDEEYQRSVDQESNLQHYLVTISLADENADFINQQVSDVTDKQRLLYYLSYRLQEDITLHEAGETLPCVLFHFERSSDIKNSRTFVLAFERGTAPDATEATLVIDSPVFGSLPVNIKIKNDNLPNIQL